jgi:hypothetical protein
MQTLNFDVFCCITQGASARFMIAVALTCRAWSVLVEKWAIANDVWRRGYDPTRAVLHRRFKMPFQLNRSTPPTTVAARLLSAFTCYCGCVSWDILSKCECFIKCDVCDTRKAFALLAQAGPTYESEVSLGGWYFSPGEVLDICRFGCDISCSKCSAWITSKSGFRWKDNGVDNFHKHIYLCGACETGDVSFDMAFDDVLYNSPPRTALSCSHDYLFISTQVPELTMPLKLPSYETIRHYDPTNCRLRLV